MPSLCMQSLLHSEQSLPASRDHILVVVVVVAVEQLSLLAW